MAEIAGGHGQSVPHCLGCYQAVDGRNHDTSLGSMRGCLPCRFRVDAQQAVRASRPAKPPAPPDTVGKQRHSLLRPDTAGAIRRPRRCPAAASQIQVAGRTLVTPEFHLVQALPHTKVVQEARAPAGQFPVLRRRNHYNRFTPPFAYVLGTLGERLADHLAEPVRCFGRNNAQARTGDAQGRPIAQGR